MGFGDKLKSAIDKVKYSIHVDKDLIKEVIKDIQRALISSDVNIQLVLKISKEIEEKAFEKIPEELTRKEHIVKICYDIILKNIGGDQEKKLEENPEKILLCGLFGSGKTTSAGKLANFYRKRGKRVGVICADVFRPAAYEQLKQLCDKVGCFFYGDKSIKIASEIVKKGLEELKDKVNLIIVDTAGRSALDDQLTLEIKDINSVFLPKYSFLVLSADIGQAAKEQAEKFNQAIGINGVIISKLDGSAKGGGALTACYITKSPIYFIGTGEKLEDIEIFDANRYLSRILGFGDLEGLLEKIKELGTEEDIDEKMAQELMKGDFTFNLFKKQLKATKRLGPFSKVINMLGIGGKIPKDQLNMGQEKIKKYGFILDSFTKNELNSIPQDITRSRIERISKGSGTKFEEVREMISHVKKMRKMFKQFGARGGNINSMMRKMGGKIPDLSKMEGMDPKQMEQMAKNFKFK
ncbi:MAG: signal recognition particle receptor subunit alpha [Candidatus ainarchaeum sp.]|nr:signal recognition particle receptor subunit alpha [Candidatus ainarchaeum sp.]MDD3976159.1 signal recognition particle receptor subunit alpha [Candidatus ainarchaeum sp.]